MKRTWSGAPWEQRVGYCRAVRAGNLVYVTGTAAVGADGSIVAPGDPYGQAKHCLALIERALREVGSSLGDVVRTRIYVTDISRWDEVGRAHAEAFAASPPATTMVEVKALIDPSMLVEIEADAVIADDGHHW